MMKYKATFWIVFTGSLALFAAPFRAVEGTGMGLDKVVHFVLFGLLAWSGFRAPWKKLTPVSFLMIYAFGVEFVQGQFLPWRSFDWMDAVAGAAGVILISVVMNRRML